MFLIYKCIVIVCYKRDGKISQKKNIQYREKSFKIVDITYQSKFLIAHKKSYSTKIYYTFFVLLKI